MDGFHTCEAIRETSHVPIIIVTGEDRDADKVRGLEMGADDYVTKPFSTTELAARVKAVLRRFDYQLPQPVPAVAEPKVDNPEVDDGAGDAHASDELLVPRVPVAAEGVYEGTVRLVVSTAGDIGNMVHFVDELRQDHRFHFLKLDAKHRRDGMEIWLRLREPTALAAALTEVEGVSKVTSGHPVDASPAGPGLAASARGAAEAGDSEAAPESPTLMVTLG